LLLVLAELVAEFAAAVPVWVAEVEPEEPVPEAELEPVVVAAAVEVQETAVGRSVTPKALQSCILARLLSADTCLVALGVRGTRTRTYAGSNSHSRALGRSVANVHQAARDPAQKALVRADALGVSAAVANAARQKLIGAALLS
jgi:hypothetical protein